MNFLVEIIRRNVMVIKVYMHIESLFVRKVMIITFIVIDCDARATLSHAAVIIGVPCRF